MSPLPEASPAPVAVAILARGSTVSPDTIEAIRAQVYEPASIHVVGLAAGVDGLPAIDHFNDLVAAVPADVAYLWVVASGAHPRPDALSALVREAERTGAGVAGSKLLDAHEPDRLVSVGVATDVFGVPYTGLDPDDVDQGQYDVVRDVAVCDGRSLLIRRDLAVGLGGVDPALSLQPSAFDLCQRARLRGARVIVVPSAEVLVEAEPEPSWRHEAGRIRAMAKIYGPVTLAWVLPMRLLAGLVEAVIAPFVGRWTLFDYLRAWVWNVWHLPGTLRSRSAARANRMFDDAELFRYQIRGSAALLTVGRDVATRVRTRIPQDVATGGIEELKRPVVVLGSVVAILTVIASRAAWTATMPVVGHSLPLPPSGSDVLAVYGGGWDPSGLGSPDQIHPSLAVLGLAQRILFDSPAIALAVVVGGVALVGVWGVARLFGRLGVEPAAGVLAGLVYVAGPAARALGESTHLVVIVAAGILPWALAAVLGAVPASWAGKIAKVAVVAWLTGVAAALFPALLPVPLLAALVWWVVGRGKPSNVVVAFIGTAAALGALVPWLTRADLGGWLSSGTIPWWEPSPLVLVAAAVALVGVLLVGDDRTSPLAGWAAVTLVAGIVLARGEGIGLSGVAALAGLVVAGLGLAAAVASAVQVSGDTDHVEGPVRSAALVALGGATILVLSTVFVIAPGRLGLPEDRSEPIDLAAVSQVDPSATRILVLGSAEAIPGDERNFEGASYRVIPTSGPTMLDAALAEPRAGDQALEAVMQQLVDSEGRRIGAALAEFGIAWVVAIDDSPFLPFLSGQLDLIPLQGLPRPTFQVEPEALVARSADGRAWFADGADFVGLADAESRVALAVNADSRWDPGPWRQVAWANEVSAIDGVARFEPVSARRTQAWLALAWFVVLPIIGWAGRRYG